MKWGKQHVYCRNCGKHLYVEIANAPYKGVVCGTVCYGQLETKEVLSIMGEDAPPEQP